MTHQHQITDAALAQQFVLAGKAKLTLVSLKTANRFTFKISQKIDDDGTRSPFFVSVLNGPDNWENYQYIGFLPAVDPTHLVAGRKGRPGAPSFKAFDFFFRNLILRGGISKTMHVWHEGQCGACGRALTVPASIATGFGPTCAEKLGIEMIDDCDEEHIPDEDGEQALMRILETNDEHREEMERDDARLGHDPYGFNDNVDDLYAEVEAEAEDDRRSQAMADKFAISF